MEGSVAGSQVTKLIPQEFSGVTEVKLITPTNYLRIYFHVIGGVILPKRDKTRRCNFPGSYAY